MGSLYDFHVNNRSRSMDPEEVEHELESEFWAQVEPKEEQLIEIKYE